MKAVQIPRFGGPEVLTLADVPALPLPPDCVRIRVSAAGVSFAEVMMRMGLYPGAPRRPFVPGFEAAGVVAETGAGVRGCAAGDRVLAFCRFGGYAEEVVVPADQVRRTPPHLSDVEAASIPVNFTTAWVALTDMARVRRGDAVLVPGAAGGVGVAAVQLAAAAGARVTALAGTPEKAALALSLGAAEAFTYEEWGRRGRAERRFDVVLEPRGGPHAREAAGLLAPAGRLVSHGVSSLAPGRARSIPRVLLALARTPLFTPVGLAMANRGVFGLNMLAIGDSAAGRAIQARAMDGVLEAFARRALRVVIDGTWPLSQAAAAHARLQSRRSAGKILLVQG
jgi:synaptic vesicle membrane protein VAT-1